MFQPPLRQLIEADGIEPPDHGRGRRHGSQLLRLPESVFQGRQGRLEQWIFRIHREVKKESISTAQKFFQVISV